MYVTAVVLLIVLAVVALLTFRGARQTAEAQEKADQLIASLEDAGARTPSQEAIVSVLGTDGGAVCANPNDALSRSVLLAQLSNGAAGPGIRPVIVEQRLFQGQRLIMEVYCPQYLEEFQQFVDDLKLTETGA
ncbi:hypothetical protein FJ693_09335 [Georgenia yuyongxinii]|uniref:Uncharacterized protein n=1 Tax=Georgenia yuyongxinii TaxID=2589797 RepID=A0A552WS27_9MICO|nr:hypothetical protein FJ693_09335 [Georgenia yuyongxinii]